MTRIIVKRLVWDERNTEHIKKHNVSVLEVEETVRNAITHQKAKQGRYLIMGRVGSRILSVVITRKEVGIYYPVTARDAAKKERIKVYEKEKKQVT